MTIQLNIGEAKTRLSELVAASTRGEEVVLAKAGRPVAKIVPIDEATLAEKKRRAVKRIAAIGMFKKEFEGFSTDIGPSMTDEDVEERFRRKFGPAA